MDNTPAIISSAKYADSNVLITYFKRCVQQDPNHAAVIFQHTTLSYGMLDQLSDQLASEILSRIKVTTDEFIGIYMNRSENLLVAILAVLKAGAAYLPLLPSYPPRRLSYILENSGAKLIISERAISAQASEMEMPVIIIEDELEKTTPSSAVLPAVAATDLMYLIYTSGTTGTPKGVPIEHGAAINIFHHFIHALELTRHDIVLALTTITFDISLTELLMPLICGATIVVASEREQMDPEMLANLISRYQITYSQATPTTWRMLIEVANWHCGRSIKIVSGGERLDEKLATALLSTGAALWNAYGPTEAAIWATMKKVVQENDVATIGWPISNTMIHILDSELQEVPPGVTGEICIAGSAITRGYHGAPDLTREKIIPHPISPDTKIYRSGDLGKKLANGEIVFLGRMDNQVKIRGYRIELDEIEQVLLRVSHIKQAAVTVREDAQQQKSLVAYIIYEWPVEEEKEASLYEKIQQELKEYLPAYMIPYNYVFLSAFPVNSNGKINKKELPPWTPGKYSPIGQEEQPATEFERELFDIWSEVMQHTNIRMTADFFELGGNSLLLTWIYKRLPDQYRDHINLQHLFKYTTIRSLAAAIEQRLLHKGDPESETEAVLNEMLNDASKLPDITGMNDLPDGNYANPEYIFLTGSTGFVGSQLLISLLDSTAAVIYCLVRATNQDTAFAKLANAFEKFLLPKELLNTDRIRVICGDISLPHMGLHPALYQEVAENTDVIYHAASIVSYIQPYELVKKANIEGVHNVIRLATTGKLKLISFTSSTAIFSWSQYFTRKAWIYENDDPAQSLPAVSRGSNYVKSKWVIENILHHARSAGVPVIIFRLGFILSHSSTGATAIDQWYARMVQTCVKVNAYPLLTGSKDALCTVDFIADAMAYISANPAAIGLNFHLTPHPAYDISTVDFLTKINDDFNMNMKPIPFKAWRDLWQYDDQSELFPLLGIYKDIVYDGQCLMELYQNSYFFDCSNTLNFLAGSSIKCPRISKSILKPYLQNILTAPLKTT